MGAIGKASLQLRDDRAFSASPRQGPDANSAGLDHNQIAQELVRVGGDDLGYHVSFRRIREAIQFQQNHATDPQALANDQLAKIVILSDQDTALGIRRLENVLIWGS